MEETPGKIRIDIAATEKKPANFYLFLIEYVMRRFARLLVLENDSLFLVDGDVSSEGKGD